MGPHDTPEALTVNDPPRAIKPSSSFGLLSFGYLRSEKRGFETSLSSMGLSLDPSVASLNSNTHRNVSGGVALCSMTEPDL